ncbi:MAG: NYN domain-containing protein [Clostridia bacterium]|nr:NYN domain-containing protein [Clostridia bacterium]
MNIFRTRNNKKKALVFVDYEYWFYSYKNKYGIRPNVTAWRQDLEKRFQIIDIMIFADFSSPSIGEELINLRNITNTIIETGTATQVRKKDMTDFVMLDYIYQSVTDRTDVGTYVIFTGDGHFQSVVKYLGQKCNKNVIIYGVESTFSSRLKAVAQSVELLPTKQELEDCYSKMILKNFARLHNKPGAMPTFWGTVESVAKHNAVSEDAIKAAMLRLIANDYVVQRELNLKNQKQVRIVVPDWDKLRRDGVYDLKNS